MTEQPNTQDSATAGTAPATRRTMHPGLKLAVEAGPLVIFFAVSTTFLETAGLELTLPTSSSTADAAPAQVTVLLAEDGTLYLDGEPIELAVLAVEMRQRLDAMDKKVVVLRADTDTPHGDVVRLMDLARESGATSLTVSARRESE